MRREGSPRITGLVLVVALVATASLAFFCPPRTQAADPEPEARLGVDPRGVLIRDWFGFAYYSPASQGGPQTDVCLTRDNAGNRTLIAIDGVASPEDPEPIFATVGGVNGADTVTFAGRTANCYYIVRGKRGGGNGAGGSGGDSNWISEFDSNPATPHFVVTINHRERSDDDMFMVGGRSVIRVELHDEDDATRGSASFTLGQQPAEHDGTGSVRFVDANGTPVDPNQPRIVTRDAPNEEVYAEGLDLGDVLVIARQAN